MDRWELFSWKSSWGIDDYGVRNADNKDHVALNLTQTDARLITAAPELLEACEKAYASLCLLHPLTGDEDFDYLRAAIARAKGEDYA